MNERIPEDDPSAPPATKNQLTVWPVSLLDCVLGEKENGRKQRMVVVTLGYSDGSVTQLAIDLSDSRRLLHRIAVVLGYEKCVSGPPPFEQAILRRWTCVRSIERSTVRIDNLREHALERLIFEVPQIAKYVTKEQASIRRALNKKNNVNVDAIVRRFTRAILIAVDTARSDT